MKHFEYFVLSRWDEQVIEYFHFQVSGRQQTVFLCVCVGGGLWVLWLTSDEDINAGGSGPDNDCLDILVIAAIVASILGTLRRFQDQPLAVRPARLTGTLADQGDPLPGGPSGRQLGLTVG